MFFSKIITSATATWNPYACSPGSIAHLIPRRRGYTPLYVLTEFRSRGVTSLIIMLTSVCIVNQRRHRHARNQRANYFKLFAQWIRHKLVRFLYVYVVILRSWVMRRPDKLMLLGSLPTPPFPGKKGILPGALLYWGIMTLFIRTITDIKAVTDIKGARLSRCR